MKPTKKYMAAVALLLGSIALSGCGSVIGDYIDEDKASDIVSTGKSYIQDKYEDVAAMGKSYIDEKTSDISSESKSYFSEKSTEVISEIIDESSAFISDIISDSEDGDDSGSFASTKGILDSKEDINLHNTDGAGTYYAFTYDSEEYKALYTEEHWRIYDSYKISNTSDMVIICQALIDVHQIHGADMESYRTADDMAYEWLQHNIAYEFLPEDNAWRVKSKDVDFNPEDQGKTFIEIYEERTGKEFSFSEMMGH